MNTMSFKHNLFINFKVVVAVNCTLVVAVRQW